MPRMIQRELEEICAVVGTSNSFFDLAHLFAREPHFL